MKQAGCSLVADDPRLGPNLNLLLSQANVAMKERVLKCRPASSLFSYVVKCLQKTGLVVRPAYINTGVITAYSWTARAG